MVQGEESCSGFEYGSGAMSVVVVFFFFGGGGGGGGWFLGDFMSECWVLDAVALKAM